MMDDFTFVRKAHRVAINSAIKGWYHDSNDYMVNEKCFGDWMDVEFKKLSTVGHKLAKGDIWGVHHKELKDATNSIWDMIFNNIDNCDIFRFVYNNYTWCYDNIETCTYHTGVAQRVIDHGFEIAGNAFQLFHMINEDDQCDTDEQTLGKIGLVVEKVASTISDLEGFQGKWDKTSHFEKLTFHEMHHNIRHKKHQTPRPHEECPVKTLYHHFFGDFNPIKEIEQTVEDTVGSLFAPVHHTPKHSQGFPFGMPMNQQSPLFFNSFPMHLF